jgi:hypothetical protein
MSEDKDNIKKQFDEIVNSEDLKKISDEFKAEVAMGTKELILIQQSLADVISHVAEILLERSKESYDFVFTGDTIYHDLLGSMYKIAEDFNEVMVDYYVDDILDDDDIDQDIEDEDNEDDNGPF